MSGDGSVENGTAGRFDARPAVWAVVAAFGTYFCMYGFRKPFTSAAYADARYGGIDFKTILVVTQVAGYMVSKFIGIRVVSEMPPHRRAMGILVLITAAWGALALFGALPRPWNAVGLFLNGLSLGMVFGFVLGFLEGRRVTEALVAGLCASFILADGVTKSVGAWLLERKVPEDWMPFLAGLVFVGPLVLCVAMLSRVSAPTAADLAARTERHVLTRRERWDLYGRYALGLTMLVAMYLLVTVMRSVRADFAPELWRGLGAPAAPSVFSYSEFYVALGVMSVNGLVVYIADNRHAFLVSLATCGIGLLLVVAALVGQRGGALEAFPFMVLIGFGLYLPYVAMHTTVFERLLAMTRERGTLGFLMYVADAFGYLAYVGVMIARNLTAEPTRFLPFFVSLCWVAVALSGVCLLVTWRYFATHAATNAAAHASRSFVTPEPVPLDEAAP